ncbi:TPA: hypothetical protein U1C44_001481 [Streptococcus suis]|nr:hypothetical protein [Streptococcus suis]
MSEDNQNAEQIITLTASELKNLIKEALDEKKTSGITIFSRKGTVEKRKHELHMSVPKIREVVEKEISRYHPMPDRYDFASRNIYNNGVSLQKLGSKINPHDLARSFALMCFGVRTNRELLASDEEKAVKIYNQLIEIFFDNYEQHLINTFGK